MLQINIGELQARLVRALGLRGRVPVTLDEMVAAEIQCYDLTNPIYAQQPVECMAPMILTGAVGGIRYFVLQNSTPGMTIRVKEIVVQSLAAAAINSTIQVVHNGVKFGTSFSGAQTNIPGGNRPALPQGQVSAQTAISANAAVVGQLSLQPNVVYGPLPLDICLYGSNNPGNADQFAFSIPDAVGNNLNGYCRWQEVGPL